MVKNGMQRVMYKGIPVWQDANLDMYLYTTEEPHIKIGTKAGLLPTWRETLKEVLTLHRQRSEPRTRAPKK